MTPSTINPTIFNIIHWVAGSIVIKRYKNRLKGFLQRILQEVMNIRHLVDESFVPSTQLPSVLYWRLSDFFSSPWLSSLAPCWNSSALGPRLLLKSPVDCLMESGSHPLRGAFSRFHRENLLLKLFQMLPRNCQLYSWLLRVFFKHTLKLRMFSFLFLFLHDSQTLGFHLQLLDFFCPPVLY